MLEEIHGYHESEPKKTCTIMTAVFWRRERLVAQKRFPEQRSNCHPEGTISRGRSGIKPILQSVIPGSLSIVEPSLADVSHSQMKKLERKTQLLVFQSKF